MDRHGFSAASAACAGVVFLCSLAAEGAVRQWLGTDAANPTLASVAANWSPAGTPAAADDILLDAASASHPLTWDLDTAVHSWTQTVGYAGLVTFRSGRTGKAKDSTVVACGELDANGTDRWFRVTGDVNLQGGGWTHAQTPPFNNTDVACTNGLGIYRLLVRCGGDFILGAGATLDASAKGFEKQTGPGRGLYANYSASHGGRGSAYSSAAATYRIPQPCYGCVKAPVCLGSGGGYSYGGGAVRLEVAGELALDGAIRVDGSDYEAGTTKIQPYYAPSGGSVFVKAGSLSGAGSISADGGICTGGGCGGGGRVAVVLTNATTFGTFSTSHLSAAGHIVNSMPSHSGTIYLETAADGGRGALLVRGCLPSFAQIDYSRAALPSTALSDPDDDYDFSEIVLSGVAVLGIHSNVVVKTGALVSENAAGRTNQLAFLGGKLKLPRESVVSNVILRLYLPGFPLDFDAEESRTTRFGAGLLCYADVPVSFPGALHLLPGSRVVHTINGAAFLYGVDIEAAGDIVVDAGAAIDAVGRGYDRNKGHGPSNLGLASEYNGGGSHGGRGRSSGLAVCYGSVTNPVLPGAGTKDKNARGGGVIALKTAGELKVDGAIAADGAPTDYSGGAGGSVKIEAASLSGSGTIRADGGAGWDANWCCGGGGRVAVRLTGQDAGFSGAPAITAYGGRLPATTKTAGPGTVWLQTAAEGEGGGRLGIDNGGRQAAYGRADLDGEVEWSDFGSVVITNGGALFLGGNRTVTVSSDWLACGGSFSGAVDSVVTFTSLGVSRIAGTNDFSDLACTVPGKTLRFGTTGSLQRINADGGLTLAGSAGAKLTLARDGDDGLWPLALYAGSSMSLQYLDVSHSDARFGALTAFATDSVDGGGNENWVIMGVIKPGETITWTGSVDSNWGVIENWNPARLPVATDCVVIPATETPPVLADEAIVSTLSIAAGASLDLAGCDVTVTNGFACAGTLIARGTECITLGGDVDFTGGSFTAAFSTLVLNGAAACSVDLANLAFHSVAAGSAAQTSFANGFTAKRFAATADAARDILFGSGVSVAVQELVLDGGGAPNLRLLSASGAWNLAVLGYAQATGVAVSNCNASGGIAIVADAPSTDLGGNANWRFAAGAVATWTGGATGDFADDTRWSTLEVPGADARVVIPAGCAVAASSAVSVRALSVAGSLAASAGLTVGDTVEVLAGGVLTINQSSVVSNFFVLRSGAVLTHAMNTTTEAHKIDLTVCGDVVIEAGAAVDVDAMGYQQGYGPGRHTPSSCAASHGGRAGWYNRESDVKSCYGSVFAPTSIGSGAMHNIDSHGGGAVKIVVAGTLRHDGSISANGLHNVAVTYYTGSGGSVFLAAGAIVGSGSIAAAGGTFNTAFAGGGGRIALYQTGAAEWSGYTGAVAAHGGRWTDHVWNLGAPQGAAGTVYRQCAGERESHGTITIDNMNATTAAKNSYTELPAGGVGSESAKAFAHAKVALSRGAVLGLTGDLTLEDLELPSGTELRLFGHTLRLRSFLHKNRAGWAGTVTEAGGAIVWIPSGTSIVVR